MSEHPARTMGELGRGAQKRFGQNFLTSPDTARRIAGLAGLGPGKKVIEIGPGLGALTTALLETGARVRAVELDRDLAARLQTELPTLELIFGDALRLDWAEAAPDGPWAVCANLPYNVATPILERLLAEGLRFDPLVLMFQREVAERLAAQPSSPAYGALSVLVQAEAEVRLAMILPPGAFHPRPKVHSAVVVLRPRAAPRRGGLGQRAFAKAVKAGFSQRRKTLENALSTAYEKPRVLAALERTVGLRRRAEELDLDAWGRLAAALEAE